MSIARSDIRNVGRRNNVIRKAQRRQEPLVISTQIMRIEDGTKSRFDEFVSELPSASEETLLGQSVATSVVHVPIARCKFMLDKPRRQTSLKPKSMPIYFA